MYMKSYTPLLRGSSLKSSAATVSKFSSLSSLHCKANYQPVRKPLNAGQLIARPQLQKSLFFSTTSTARVSTTQKISRKHVVSPKIHPINVPKQLNDAPSSVTFVNRELYEHPFLKENVYNLGDKSRSPIMTCTTLSTSEKYNLATVISQFHSEGLRSASIILPGEVAHVQYPYAPGKIADILIIANGSLVAWGMSEQEVLEKIVPILKPAEINPYVEAESEDMDYVEEDEHGMGLDTRQINGSSAQPDQQQVQSELEENNQNTESKSEEGAFETSTSETHSEDSENHCKDDGSEKSQISTESHQQSQQASSTMVGDIIVIRGPNYIQRLLVKAAFSSGLARSTKLAILENRLETHIDTTKQYIDNLAKGKDLGIAGKEVLRLTGQLLQLRGQLNLYTELSENSPDLYWSEPELESLYLLISRKLDVMQRINLLNKKLDYAAESLSILKSHISEEQGVRLEWMIIILIMVEVCFEITHFIEKYHERVLAWFSPVAEESAQEQSS